MKYSLVFLASASLALAQPLAADDGNNAAGTAPNSKGAADQSYTDWDNFQQKICQAKSVNLDAYCRPVFSACTQEQLPQEQLFSCYNENIARAKSDRPLMAHHLDKTRTPFWPPNRRQLPAGLQELDPDKNYTISEVMKIYPNEHIDCSINVLTNEPELGCTIKQAVSSSLFPFSFLDKVNHTQLAP
ncbi:hypothetical protein HRG_010860 [Hirsutella rhossiliensis]|uniref:Secreted protein n=1 Tax=Hirsutella rhossiliensis TaxID=111463 RepID=A0A9P8MN31_9HYPO|nr:uncharacterized protein HRG_10860 [Hirsutella rhossiliensis]KAH0958165.1 hypothetical protein HRG_10860 [Hirsutella rhossiliensis]